ncbi:hypothetical protein ZOSMA_292G00280 [Zostera marina]|uniref:60S ribosomal protein L18a-like protein n=1 Tax=Zostera marina TaxID=29655 RepID=A0A0K9PC36_ZOSMR|nr:hypothetical protein ZOSMA_292G00280 [Zostera marina]
MEQGLSFKNVKDIPQSGYIQIADDEEEKEDPRLSMFDKPLPCFGCGIGWLSFLLGFMFPLIWYYAMLLYFCKYYNRDPRERGGLAASAVMALLFTIVAGITIAVLLS